MPLVIDTAEVPPADRIAYWSRTAADSYQPCEILAEPSVPFAARMWGDHLADVQLFLVATSPNTMRRGPDAVAAGNADCLHLTAVRRGHLQVAQQERAALVGPGDLTCYSTSLPATTQAQDNFEGLVLRVPFRMLNEHPAEITRVTALRIPGRDGLARILTPFFWRVAAALRNGTLSRDNTEVAAGLVGLVRALLAPRIELEQASFEQSPAGLRIQAKAFIEANLGDPDLSAERIAGACFISIRYLHRLFEGESVTVGQWIRNARLERARQDLRDPGLAGESILAIATHWGLPNSAHFSRLFREAYGRSPRKYRAGAP